MKITRFPQSCFLIETLGKKILLDPGTLLFSLHFIDQWKSADAIFITHKHADHCHAEILAQLQKENNVKVYATKETAAFYPQVHFEQVTQGQKMTLGKVTVEAVQMVHGYHPLLKGEKEVHEGVGYIIHGDKKAYHTGDTICFKNEYHCDVVMFPYNNHGVAMSPFEAALFALETKASLALPCHDDNAALPADKEKMKKELEGRKLTYRFLNVLETIEI